MYPPWRLAPDRFSPPRFSCVVPSSQGLGPREVSNCRRLPQKTASGLPNDLSQPVTSAEGLVGPIHMAQSKRLGSLENHFDMGVGGTAPPVWKSAAGTG